MPSTQHIIWLPHVFLSRNIFVDAVNTCDTLKIVFPDKEEDCKAVQTGYQAKSSHGLIKGCIGCIDGLLVKIKRPSKKECGNTPSSNYSGNYYCYSFNIQAVCDVNLCFIFFPIAAPGKLSDQAALEKTSLNSILNQLPLGSYIIGDAAYTVSDQMLVPFTGPHHQDSSKDSFNYFLSQMRICI